MMFVKNLKNLLFITLVLVSLAQDVFAIPKIVCAIADDDGTTIFDEGECTCESLEVGAHCTIPGGTCSIAYCAIDIDTGNTFCRLAGCEPGTGSTPTPTSTATATTTTTPTPVPTATCVEATSTAGYPKFQPIFFANGASISGDILISLKTRSGEELVVEGAVNGLIESLSIVKNTIVPSSKAVNFVNEFNATGVFVFAHLGINPADLLVTAVIQTANGTYYYESVLSLIDTGKPLVSVKDKGGSSVSGSIPPVCTGTPTATPTATSTATVTQTATPTATSTINPTNTVTPTVTTTATVKPTGTATVQPTSTINPTNTVTPTATSTATVTQTATPTATSTINPTNTVTPTVTTTATVKPTGTATVQPTSTINPTNTVTPTVTTTATVKPTSTVEPTKTATPTATSTATATATSTVEPTKTATATGTATPTATATNTAEPTNTATPAVTGTATAQPTGTATGSSTPVPPNPNCTEKIDTTVKKQSLDHSIKQLAEVAEREAMILAKLFAKTGDNKSARLARSEGQEYLALGVLGWKKVWQEVETTVYTCANIQTSCVMNSSVEGLNSIKNIVNILEKGTKNLQAKVLKLRGGKPSLAFKKRQREFKRRLAITKKSFEIVDAELKDLPICK